MNIFFKRCFFVFSALSLINLKATTLEVLDTIGNTVGIKEEDEAWITTSRPHATLQIRTASGRTFEPITELEVSLTGTPAHLMYENYIGSRISEPQKAGKMGSGKRSIFCNGTSCVLKKK